MQLWALIADGFRESRDRKIFWVMLIMSLLVAGLMAAVSFLPNKIDFFFGTWQVETDTFTRGGVVDQQLVAALAVDFVLDLILGSIGIILAIVATAGFFPAMMERGAIEVLLSKPLSRPKLFLGKYIGSMAFIAFQAAAFVLLTFLVVGLRWKVWIPGYLLAIPLVVLLFSYIYCISALVAVLTRSTVAAVLVSLGAWAAFAGVQNAADLFYVEPTFQQYERAYNAVKIARWIVPKTQDIAYKAKHWCKAATSTEFIHSSEVSADDARMLSRADQLERERMSMPATYTIGSSLLFEAVIVALAMWRFTRRDY